MDKWEFLEIMGPGRYSDVKDKSHPSWGGNAYSLDVRAEIITRCQLG